MSALALWQLAIVFLLAAAVLVRGGVTLAAAGDALVARTSLGALFVGVVLMAFATSLPEIVTDVSAALKNAPNLAVGDLFGSSMANMAVLAVIDLMHRGRVWPTVELGHARVASVAIALTAVAILGVLVAPDLAVGWVGVDTIVIGAMYVAALAWFRRSPTLPRRAPITIEPPTVQRTARTDGDGDGGARGPVLRFAGAAMLILVSAPVVALSSLEMAHQTGVAETFVGTTLLAITTSLPELIVSIAALRLGAYDLAVGNLFGSNAANMSVLLIADIAYTKGPILGAVDAAQTVAAVGAILLMALALAAIVHGSETRIRRLEPDAVILLLVYLLMLIAVAVRA